MHATEELQRVIGSPTSPVFLKDTDKDAAATDQVSTPYNEPCLGANMSDIVQFHIAANWLWNQAGDNAQLVELSPSSPDQRVHQASGAVSQHHSIILTAGNREESCDEPHDGSKGVEEQHKNPFPLTCAFGFTGKFEIPPVAPSTKQDFLVTVNTELATVIELSSGFKAYQDAINQHANHVLSMRFLERENTAIRTTLYQLDGLASYLSNIRAEVEVKDDDFTVENDILTVFHQSQIFVARARAILVHCHVFFKINFVLVAKKVH